MIVLRLGGTVRHRAAVGASRRGAVRAADRPLLAAAQGEPRPAVHAGLPPPRRRALAAGPTIIK